MSEHLPSVDLSPAANRAVEAALGAGASDAEAYASRDTGREVRVHGGDPAVLVGDQAGAGPGQQRRRHVAQRLQPALVRAPQARLGQLHRGADERDRGGMDGLGRPADVDDAEQLTGAGVVHRARGARPHVVGAHEVLGREHLHRRGLGQGRADGVGADHALRPGRPLGEPEPVGAVAHRGGALPPQQHAVGVGDHHDVAGVLGHRRERRTQLGQHPLQR